MSIRTHFPSKAEPPMGTTKQAKMTNYNKKFDRISKQQYYI